MIDARRMEAATRLTRAGKLHEAMAILQGALPEERSQERDQKRSEEAADNAYCGGTTFEGTCWVIDEEVPASKPGSDQSSPHRNGRPSAGAAPSSAFDEVRKTTAGTTPGGDIGLPSAWREKWRQLRDAMAQPEQAQGTYEAARPGAFTAGHFTHHAGAREYKLYLPSGYHGQALPLVVMLHGCTQNPDDFAAGTDMNRLAEEQQFCVLYPAQPMTANRSKCWNWFKAEDQQREGGEPAILAGMTRQIIDTYELDASRVYVAGLSAGGAMATTLAMTYPDLYAAVGVHSGLPHGVAQSLPDALGAMQGGTGPLGDGGMSRASEWSSEVPAIIFHGDHDTTVHPSNADRVAAQYAASRRAGETPRPGSARVTVEQGKVASGHGYTRTTHHDAKGEPRLEQWRVTGAGHAWAGGSAKGSYTDPRGPDASGEMLRFFHQHRQGKGRVS